jgi:endonuclease/exonuclease/phosphatase family metal-dependent hydrolase
MHITLATYNIHACIGADSRFGPERTVQVLQELDADVVTLQEVEHHAIDDYDCSITWLQSSLVRLPVHAAA